jgi:uncharacterized membrane protein
MSMRADTNTGHGRDGHVISAVHDGERILRWIGSHEKCWPAEVAIVVSAALYLLLPKSLLVGPRYLLPGLELALLLVIRTTSGPRTAQRRGIRCLALARHPGERVGHRRACIGLILLITFSNAATLTLLSNHILNHANSTNGKQLLLAALSIWVTNVLVFALWYWETDRGGPGQRAAVQPSSAGEDFRFPQEDQDESFSPSFIDYLYLAFTNATAFSPTDALPVTHRAKLAMMGQSLVSLLTVLLVAARAVNILN